MSGDTLNGVLRRGLFPLAGAPVTDGDLLGRFVESRDEAAFEALLRRHGPMVLGVCRRALRNEADAEDAFQAVFLVLAMKAVSVSPREMVGNWLYGVARNTSTKVRTMNAKRRARERDAGAITRHAGRGEVSHELPAVIDAELTGLPDRYRTPIVLCDLDGKTIATAAAQLGWPPGTLATRLRRGRRLLAKRLAGRGLTLSTGLAALSSVGVPDALLASATRSAAVVAAARAVTPGVVSVTVAALTEGVLKSMTNTKVHAALAVAVLLCGLGGAAVALTNTGHEGPVSTPAGEPPTAHLPGRARVPAPRPADADKLQGIWTGALTDCRGGLPAADEGGKAFLRDALAFQALVKGDQLTLRGPDFMTGVVGPLGQRTEVRFTFKLDAAEKPKRIDLTLPPEEDDRHPVVVLGAYELDGDSLALCLSCPNKKRPTGLTVQPGFAQVQITLKRAPDAVWEERRQPNRSSPPDARPLPATPPAPGATGSPLREPAAAAPETAAHLAWLAGRAAEADRIRPGVTRADVEAVFVRADRGYFPPGQMHYLLRECPFVQVWVTYQPAPGKTVSNDHPDDVVAEVAGPYLRPDGFDAGRLGLPARKR